MENICPICGGREFEDLDNPVVPCGLCSKKEKPDPKCPQCGGKGEFKIPLRNHSFWYMAGLLYSDPIGFQCCKSCGFLNYAPRPHDDVFKHRNKQQIQPAAIALSKRQRDAIEEMLPEDYYMDVLEVNCGLGYNANSIKKSGGNFYGIEFNHNYAQYAEAVNGVGFDVPRRPADLIIINGLEREINPVKFLTEICCELTHRGHLLIDVPLYENEISNQSGKGARNFELLYHLQNQNCFSRASLGNLALILGFEMVKEYCGTGRVRQLWKQIPPATEKNPIRREDYKEIKKKLVRQAQSITTFEDAWNKGKDQNRKEEAAADIMRSLDIYAWNLEGWIGLSLCGENHKDVNKVYKIYLQAKKFFPDSEAIDLHFANLFKNWGEPENETNWTKLAREMYTHILAKNPTNYEARMGIFYLDILFNPDNFVEISETYELLIEKIPESYTALTNLWITYHQRQAQRKREK